jgi:PAS domain S-box-containing protein
MNHEPVPLTMRIRNKTALIFAALSVTALLVSSLFTFNFARSELTSSTLKRLEAAASTQASRLQETLAHQREQLLLISSRTQLRRSLDQYLDHRQPSEKEVINKILDDAAAPIEGFLQIDVVDPDGKLVASSSETDSGNERVPLSITEMPNQTEIQRLMLLDEYQRLNQQLVAPLFLDGRIIGSVVVRTDGRKLVEAIGDFAGLGHTGDSYLLRPEPEQGGFQYLTPARFDSEAALRRQTDANNGLDDLSILADGEVVLTQGTDYRGQPVFAAATVIANSDWILVIKVDQREVFAPIGRLRTFWITVFITVLVLVIAVSFYLSRLITQPIVELSRRMDRYGDGDIAIEPVVNAPYQEIDQLTQAFQRMVEGRNNAETTLRKDEQRLRLHREQAPLGMIEWDTDFRVTDWNLAAEKIFGYSREQALGRHASELLLTPEVREHIDEIWDDLLNQRGGHHSINENVTRDGTVLLCEWHNTTLVDDTNTVIAVASLIEDITEQSRRQQEVDHFQAALLTWGTADYLNFEPTLQMGTELTARTLRASIASVWLFDDETGDALCQDLYVLGKDCHLVAEPSRTGDYPNYRAALSANRVLVVSDFRGDPRMQEFADSTRAHPQLVSVLEAPIRRHGEIVGTVACDHHGEPREWSMAEQEFVITVASTLSLALEARETQLAESSLRRSERELRQILESMVDGVITFDAAGRILSFNPAAETMFGYQATELIGSPILELSPESERDRLENYLAPFLKGQSTELAVANAELQGCRKDGEEFSLRLSLSELRVGNEGERRFIISCADTTVQKQQEEQLRSTQKMDALGKLTGGLAHDYNNMLHVILSYAGMLESGLESDPRLPDPASLVVLQESAQKSQCHQGQQGDRGCAQHVGENPDRKNQDGADVV